MRTILFRFSEKITLCVFVNNKEQLWFRSHRRKHAINNILSKVKHTDFVLVDANIMPLFKAIVYMTINKWLEFSFTFLLLAEHYLNFITLISGTEVFLFLV